MLRVGVNGYGTIGKRVADAIRAQPDMVVCGVAKRSPDYVAVGAAEESYPVYAVDGERTEEFRSIGIDLAGTVDELVDESDVMVDATPSGVGADNRSLYERHDTPALFQGGEDATVAEVSFNARVNYEEATGADYARVVSCNTTGLSRFVAPIEENYGIEKARATLIRRGGDPDQTGRGPINDAVPDPVSIPSHHGPDVQTIFPDLDIDTIGLKVPTTMMHVHAVNVTLEEAPDDVSEIRDRLRAEDRLVLIPEYAGIDGAGTLKDFALDAGRPRGDIWENCIWEESLTLEGSDLYCMQAIHQESDVVPENVDALRALSGHLSGPESRSLTNETLGIGLGRLDGREDLTLDRQTAD
ncbi:type II glyceraldehyde-3-phosphate dehydrogenase [Natrarchaeobius halalkaliphilus]|uniref:Glyceraldehyde-3-phosphate dehydrogenase n=1 Tax=Natrarchaeobius halalkaliphilus TaxID=1679091 RepID=A0A3N6N442_9EURY|nr:type II glyceraldehyde-3-phosphate dehydrogenase [Natrarchaeobius halalkaliphilus]RQG92932.1 type II glyceraldehyde-3-phosphate dehydrogenase [Natrarchaeobius halalkaliphilus]